LPDTSTTYPCDKQPFVASARCEGATCSVEPSQAGGSGVNFDGEGVIRVRPTSVGDLTLSIELEHGETGERFKQSHTLLIREPDRLVIDCWFNSDPRARNCTDAGSQVLCEETWTTCKETFAVETDGGNPFSIWIYGEAAGLPVALVPQVSFEGFSADTRDFDYVPTHDNPQAVEEASRFSTIVTQPGTYTISAVHQEVSVSFTTAAR
jgi:hypothetical protein